MSIESSKLSHLTVRLILILAVLGTNTPGATFRVDERGIKEKRMMMEIRVRKRLEKERKITKREREGEITENEERKKE